MKSNYFVLNGKNCWKTDWISYLSSPSENPQPAPPNQKPPNNYVAPTAFPSPSAPCFCCPLPSPYMPTSDYRRTSGSRRSLNPPRLSPTQPPWYTTWQTYQSAPPPHRCRKPQMDSTQSYCPRTTSGWIPSWKTGCTASSILWPRPGPVLLATWRTAPPEPRIRRFFSLPSHLPPGSKGAPSRSQTRPPAPWLPSRSATPWSAKPMHPPGLLWLRRYKSSTSPPPPRRSSSSGRSTRRAIRRTCRSCSPSPRRNFR